MINLLIKPLSKIKFMTSYRKDTNFMSKLQNVPSYAVGFSGGGDGAEKM